MASEWLFPTDESGHDEPVNKDSQEELFVFGYACKLFRDDDQAKLIDVGKYMIPWMGDDQLKIDRYDGRGHLYDLSPYDVDNLKGKPVLSEDEKQLEKLCDDERYLELRTDMAEKTMYEEEEWKRYYESLSEGYKAVGFSYDAYGQQFYKSEFAEPEEDLDEQPFVPPPELQVPPGCDIPVSVKLNSIIEKTAKFIAEHGAQMEIMMKTKQADNPQFLFMHFENTLHPYYRNMVKMIKLKKYIPKSPVKQEEDDDLNENGENEEGYHGYLHPTLVATNRASPTPEVYKPVPMPKVCIHETSYGQLLKSFSEVDKEVREKNKAKEIKKEVKSEPEDGSSLPEYVGQVEYGPAHNNMPPPPGIEPVTLPKASTKPSLASVKQEPGEWNVDDNKRTTSPPVQIVPPPPDAQPVVDRMAMYVAKNGEEFEIVVKSKKDPRFQFLEPWHMHFSYYSFKKHLFIEEMERERKEKEIEEKKIEKEKAEKLAKGVKFKLKKNKEQESTTLEKKKVFEYDESTDEEHNGDMDGVKEKRSKSNASGTSTPVLNNDVRNDSRNDEMMVKKLAEQKVKDRLSASAREKLSQADKEKQIKAERKKKAAMFLNMLKSKNTVEDEADNKTASTDSEKPTPLNSGRNSPVRAAEPRSSSHKSKHKSRDRSRDRSSKSRVKRSRSRSSSRSKKKKKRSPTPPSAYAVVRRPPLRRPPPPPPPRYVDAQNRYSRSPSRSSRHKSRSPSKSKSKKKKRSRSPRSRRDDSNHKKSSKKKKRRSRSKSRSPTKESSRLFVKSSITEEEQDSEFVIPEDARVLSPAAVDGTLLQEAIDDELEDGETRDSWPDSEQIKDNETDESENIGSKGPTPPPDITSDTGSLTNSPKPPAHPSGSPSHSSRSSTPSTSTRSTSQSPRKRLLSRSRSRSFSPSSMRSIGTTPKSSRASTEASPMKEMNGDGDVSETEISQPQKNVSSYMLNRVRAIIQASKAAVGKEEDMFADS